MTLVFKAEVSGPRFPGHTLRRFGVTALGAVATLIALSSGPVFAQVPNTFVPNTPIKAADVNANFSALQQQKQASVTGTCPAGTAIGSIGADGSVACNLGPTGSAGPPGPPGASGPSGVINLTQLVATTEVDDSSPGAFKFLRNIGTFSKANAATNLVVTWSSHVSGLVTTTGMPTACEFQVRVDGVLPFTNDFGASILPTTILTYENVSLTRLFLGFGAGTHTVSIWSGGFNAAICIDNAGGLNSVAVVSEQ